MITIEVWHNQRLWAEWDYKPEYNQMETIGDFIDALDALEAPGEQFTLIARKIS